MWLKVFAGRLVFAGRIFGLLFLGLPARAEGTPSSPREKLLMDFGWRFHLGDEWGFSERRDRLEEQMRRDRNHPSIFLWLTR